MMHDLRSVAPRARVGGQWATFTGFEHRKDDECCIDFVFGHSDGGWYVIPTLHPTEVGSLCLRARGAECVFVETALSDDGMLASDHRLVFADIISAK